MRCWIVPKVTLVLVWCMCLLAYPPLRQVVLWYRRRTCVLMVGMDTGTILEVPTRLSRESSVETKIVDR